MNNQVSIQGKTSKISVTFDFPINTVPTTAHVEWVKSNMPTAKVDGRGVPIPLTDILTAAMENNIMVEAFVPPLVDKIDAISAFPNGTMTSEELGIRVAPAMHYRYVIADNVQSRLYQNTSVIEALVEGTLEILKEQGKLPTL